MLEAPLRRGGDDALAHVRGHRLGVRVLAATERVEHVALGDDAGDRLPVVVDQRGADTPLGHLRRNLAQRMRGPDGQHHL
jgi:hypothetical protein